MKPQSQDFYDEYSARQVDAGIHHRHLSIQRWLEKFDFPTNGQILEIGCGIGTQTQLMLQHMSPRAKLTSIDLSEKSIEIAKARLKKYDNLKLIAANVLDTPLEGKFDFIVMPDVLEHIPLDTHELLFEKLSSALSESGKILIHIPSPQYLEWVIQYKPHRLQIIDNPLYTNILLNHVYKSGLKIEYLNTYSIFNTPGDYQVIVLTKNRPTMFEPLDNPVKDSLYRRLRRKIKYLVRGN